MKKLNKATCVLAKLMEIGHWIGVVGMIVGLVLLFTMGEKAVAMTPGQADVEAAAYGFEITLTNSAGTLNMTALRLFFVGSAILLGLMAMVFRNIYLIMKKSENATPFQKDNVRMIREIGIFLLVVPVVGLIMSVVARLVLGVDNVEASVGLDSFMVGLVVLCLSQFFAQGMALEADVDGLL